MQNKNLINQLVTVAVQVFSPIKAPAKFDVITQTNLNIIQQENQIFQLEIVSENKYKIEIISDNKNEEEIEVFKLRSPPRARESFYQPAHKASINLSDEIVHEDVGLRVQKQAPFELSAKKDANNF